MSGISTTFLALTTKLCAACGDHHGLRDRQVALPGGRIAILCHLCSKEIQKGRSFFFVSLDQLWRIEAKNTLRQGVLAGDEEATAVWNKTYGADRKERSVMAALFAAKCNLP